MKINYEYIRTAIFLQNGACSSGMCMVLVWSYVVASLMLGLPVPPFTEAAHQTVGNCAAFLRARADAGRPPADASSEEELAKASLKVSLTLSTGTGTGTGTNTAGTKLSF